MKNVGNIIFRIAKECRISPEESDNLYLILGLLCFRFISEKSRKVINKWMFDKGNTDFDYLNLSDNEAEQLKKEATEKIGYYLYPSQLYDNLCKSDHEDILRDISLIFRNIQNHLTDDTLTCRSGIFSRYLTPSNTTLLRNDKVKELLNRLNSLPYDDLFENQGIDIFESVIALPMFGRNHGEFYIPGTLAELIVKLVVNERIDIKNVYCPFSGCGMLMSKFSKILPARTLSMCGTEMTPGAINLCWINLVLNQFRPNQFVIKMANPLTDNCLEQSDKFDIVTTCYTKNLDIIDHLLTHMNDNSTSAILTSSGTLFRGGHDKEIRERLIKNNLIRAIIQLPPKTLIGQATAPCIIIINNKTRKRNGIFFIDASIEFPVGDKKDVPFKDITNRILDIYSNQKEITGFSRFVSREEILENEGNLQVSHYIENNFIRQITEDGKELSKWERTYQFNNSTLRIKFGDLTTSEAEVFVSSDDTGVTMGGGVSQSILEAGGDFVRVDAQKKLPALMGDVIVSTAGQLSQQKYIFHCLTIDYKHDESFYQAKLSGKTTMNEYIIRHSVDECFRLMQALNIKSIAFPLIGTGFAGIDINLTAKVMSESLSDCLSRTNKSYQIELYLMDRFGEKSEFDYLRIFEYFGTQEILNASNRQDAMSERDILKEDPLFPELQEDYPVFISFSDKDWDIVKKLILKVLNKEGIQCFAYKKENYAGSSYKSEITRAIKKAKVVIFASTKNSIASKEVEKEIDFSESRGKKIIPIRLDDTPYSDELDYDLRRIDYIDIKRMPNATQKLIDAVKFEIRRSTIDE